MKNYSPFDSLLADLTPSELIRLKETSEGWYVEYKRGVVPSKELGKSISAFANTYGGWLFLGVDEESKSNPVAGSFPGIPEAEVDAAIQKLRKAAVDSINPTPFFDYKILRGPATEVGLPAGQAVICVHIPRSSKTPHVHKSGSIYRRVADSSEPRPETDRFMLDKLWQRGDEIKRQHEVWLESDPEFGELETGTFLRVMLDPDPWRDKGFCIDVPEQQIRDLFRMPGDSVSGLPFDSVHQTGRGLIARQLAGNDPNHLSLTWDLGWDFKSDILIPLPQCHATNVEELAIDLQGYETVERFVRVIEKYHLSALRIVDLTMLFNLLVGVADMKRRLCELVGWRDGYHFKYRLLNAWRTIPFIDLTTAQDHLETNGLSMCLSSTVTYPSRTGPDRYIEIERALDIDDPKFRCLAQGTLMFSAVAIAYGISMPTDQDHFSDYLDSISRAGSRAVDVVQPRRVQRARSQ